MSRLLRLSHQAVRRAPSPLTLPWLILAGLPVTGVQYLIHLTQGVLS